MDEYPSGFGPLHIACGRCGKDMQEDEEHGGCEEHSCEKRICVRCYQSTDGYCMEHK